ncbi:hypothetical protein ABLN73_05985 [Mycobacterium tuberculosis]
MTDRLRTRDSNEAVKAALDGAPLKRAHENAVLLHDKCENMTLSDLPSVTQRCN